MSGKVLLVGASGGVGQAVAKQLLERGYEVLGTALDQRDLEQVRQRVPGLKNLFLADFSNADIGRRAVEAALQQTEGPIVAVIGCAGISRCGPIETTPLSVLRATMEVNALTNVAAYQAALPYLRQSKGKFIFLSSSAGKVATPLLGYYAASKFALEGLADVMRFEAGQWGVTVTLIEPGAVATPMSTDFNQALDACFAGLSGEAQANYRGYFDQNKAYGSDPNTRYLSPEEVAVKVVEVLETVDPEPRHTLGNAVELIARRRDLSDRDHDELWNAMMPGNRVPAH